MGFLTIFLTVIGGLLSVVYIFFKHKFMYWKRLGVDSHPPSFPFGNFGDNFTMKLSFAEVCENIYKRAKGPFVGVYLMFKPGLLIIDPEIVRDILIKDSQNFLNRGLHFHEETDKLSGNLFFLTDEKWKAMRTKLTPTFTSGRLKMMSQTICDCGQGLERYLLDVAEKSGQIDARDILSRFTVNNIMSVAFGVEIDCINKKEDQVFHDIGLGIFKPSLTNLSRQFFNIMVPEIASILKTRISDPKAEAFLVPFVKKNMEYREKNNIVRRDFFQLLIQLRNTGTVQLDDNWETTVVDDSQKKFTIEELSAQSFVFFAAGFETTASTMSYVMYELAKNHELQNRVRQEIVNVLSKNDGQVTYDSLNEMKYLESVIDETLRKYPPLPFLNRECSMPYKIRNSNVVIPAKTAIHFPILALHRDPKYYPDPLKFDPDRFYVKGNMDPSTPYYPFGDGPRICIGARMGKLTTKIGLTTMLRYCKYELSDELKKCEDLEFNPLCTILTPKLPLNFIVKRI